MRSTLAVETAISAHLEAIRSAARECPAGGGGTWDVLLTHYGVQPLDSAERAAITVASGMLRGATAAEVRRVLVGLEAWARSELGQCPADADRARIEASLGGIVERETEAHERAVGVAAPPALAATPAQAPSLGSIFANAERSSKEVPWASVVGTSVVSLTCAHCGAPQARALDFLCSFCRRPIAGPAPASR